MTRQGREERRIWSAKVPPIAWKRWKNDFNPVGGIFAGAEKKHALKTDVQQVVRSGDPVVAGSSPVGLTAYSTRTYDEWL
jgi:hypothetical protein